MSYGQHVSFAMHAMGEFETVGVMEGVATEIDAVGVVVAVADVVPSNNLGPLADTASTHARARASEANRDIRDF